jgi:hypothetical protein
VSGGALPLLARLGEAASFPKAVSNYESDPWGYMRRKLQDCEAPLKDYKKILFDAAAAKLLADLNQSFLPPGSLMDHKETFEKLLTAADFADLSFNLEPGGDPQVRRENVTAVFAHAHIKTLFDVEKLPPERRSKAWQALVDDAFKRLDLDRLKDLYARKPNTDFRRNYVIRRVRRNLGEFLAVTRDQSGMRDDVTLFMLTRLEAAIAALLRFLGKTP